MKTNALMPILNALTLLLIASVGITADARPALSPPPQNGPNCFNTTLVGLGYVDQAVYSSAPELEFYLKHFCQPIINKTASTNQVITFKSDQLVHSAISFGDGLILEKNSLYGTLFPAFEYDPQPGQYLFHPESQSIFSPKQSKLIFSEVYERSVFQCLPQAEVKKRLSALNHPAVLEQLAYRKFISKFVHTGNRITLEEQLRKEVLPAIIGMKWNDHIKKIKLDKDSKDYLIGLLRSNTYQTHLLLCSESHKTEGECYTPQLTDLTNKLNQWFEQIYQLEN